MPEDKFSAEQPSITGPATGHWLIEPDDNADLPRLPRAIRCESAGTIVIRDKDEVDLTYTMGVGEIIDFRGVRVLDTGTSGTFYGWD